MGFYKYYKNNSPITRKFVYFKIVIAKSTARGPRKWN